MVAIGSCVATVWISKPQTVAELVSSELSELLQTSQRWKNANSGFFFSKRVRTVVRGSLHVFHVSSQFSNQLDITIITYEESLVVGYTVINFYYYCYYYYYCCYYYYYCYYYCCYYYCCCYNFYCYYCCYYFYYCCCYYYCYCYCYCFALVILSAIEISSSYSNS